MLFDRNMMYMIPATRLRITVTTLPATASTVPKTGITAKIVRTISTT